MQGMAFDDSFARKPKAFEGSVFLDSEHCVLGTGGEKSAAMSEEGAQGRLVESDKKDDEFHEYYGATSV